MAGLLSCNSAPGCYCGAGGAFLRFPVARSARRYSGACGFTQRHAVPDLPDGPVGRGHCAVHCVLLHLPPSPEGLTSADTTPVLSEVFRVVCTASSHALAFSVFLDPGIPEK